MRIRTIKPEFFKHEGLADLSAHHRLLFQGLWLLADRDGRLEDRARRIHVEVFPYEPKLNVPQMLDDLTNAGFIRRYVANGVGVIDIPGFLRCQRPHHTERAGELPAYEERNTQGVLSPLPHGESREGKEGNGRERKGMESGERASRTPPAPRLHRWPEGFTLTDERRQFAVDGGIGDPELVWGAFKDHHLARGSLFVDWGRAWQTWCRKEVKWDHQRRRA